MSSSGNGEVKKKGWMTKAGLMLAFVAGLLVFHAVYGLSEVHAAVNTYYVEANAAVNVGIDGSTNMTTLVDLAVTGGSSNQNRAYTNTTAPTGTTRYRIREGANDTRTGQEFFRAYTPTYAGSTTIAANATAYADFYMNGTGTSVVADATLYEYNDTTGIVGAAKGTASFTGDATITTRQTMNNVSFGNASFTVAAGNRLMVIFAFDMNNSRPAYLWGQSASAIPSGYQSFTVNESVTATTTLANGVAGTNATVCPGAVDQKLDGFSFQTSVGTDSVTGLTVTTTGTAAIASVEIWNEAGTTQYFSTVSVPSGNNWVFSGGTPIPVTTTLANFKILVTYDDHATAPAGNTTTTANVTAFTSGNNNTKAGTDTADTTLTLDHTAANAATWGANSGGIGQVTLNWTLGTAGDSVMIVRYTTNTDTTMPAGGTTYTVGNSFGVGGTIVFIGTGTTTTDSAPVGTYYYRIFEFDGCLNYAATAPWSGALTVTAATTTLGNGVAGTNATVCPGAVDQKLDGFSFQTSVGTDSVTGLTVTTTGTAAIASVEIWNEAGTTQYFSTVSVPSGNNWVFSGGTPIPVTTTLANFKILVTYDDHATAPAGNTTTTANVTAFTSGNNNTKAGTDTADTTLTLDHTAANAATWGVNSGGIGQATLNWTLGTAGDSVMIVRYTTNTDTTMPTGGTTYTVGNSFGVGGTIVFIGTGTTTTDSAPAGTYYYKIFEFDGCLNYAATAPWSGALTVTSADAKIVYSINTTTPQYRDYSRTSNSFGSQNPMPTGAAQTFMVDRAALTRNEHMAGYVTTGGVLYIYKWDGSTWIEVTNTAAPSGWGVGSRPTVGGDGVNGRRFDIAYEKTSGKAMVVYSTNVTTSGGAKLAYRTWDGSTWSPATNITTARSNQTAAMTWVKLKSNPLAASNEIALVACDTGTTTANTGLMTALIWNGTAWTEAGTAFTNATYGYIANTTGQLVQNDLFDLAYESVSGGLLVVYTTTGGTTPNQYYRTYSAGTWGTPTSYGTGRTAPLQMVAESNPQSDQILVMWNRSTSANVYANVWTGTAVGTTTTVVATGVAPAINEKTISGKWLVVGGVSYAVALSDTTTAGTIGYGYFNGSTTTWTTAQTYNSGTGAAINWMDTDVDPLNPNTMMLTFSTGAATTGSLWAKRLVLGAGPTFTWTNADGGSAESTALASATSQNFSFDYNRFLCARNAPTVTFAPTSGNVTPGGNVPYTVTVTNNDTAGCSNSTFTVSRGTETGTAANFVLPSTLSGTTPSPCTLAPGGTCTATLTVTAQAGATIGATNTTTINAADATNHASQTGSGNVTTTVACPRSAPSVTFAPASGSVVPGGNVAYTVTITNNDGAGCSNSTFTVSRGTETGTAANFVLPSTLSGTTPSPCTLAPGGTCTATLTVTAQAGATIGATNTTTINAADATNHASQTGSGNVTTTVASACSRALPTVSLSPGARTVGPGNSVIYTLSITNNDSAGCGNSTFNITETHTTLAPNFASSTLGSASTGALAPGATYTTTITHTAAAGAINGATLQSYATTTDSNHAAVTSNTVVTTVSTAACVASAPLVNIVPAAGTVTVVPGSTAYTITITNSDSATCALSTFTLSKTDTNATNFSSTLSATNPNPCALRPADSCTATLTVNALSGAPNGSTDTTTVTAGGHTPTGSRSVTTDVNTSAVQSGDGYLLKRSREETCQACHKTNYNAPSDPNSIKTHNSAITGSTKWSGNWGVNSGSQYGQIVCTTCHTSHGTPNIYLVKQTITAPSGSFPGSAVDFRVKSGTAGVTAGMMGDDTGGHANSSRVCEVCHSQNKYHNWNTANNTGGLTHNNATDCTGCHSHKGGFQFKESDGCSVDPVSFAKCSTCHPATWAGINSGSSKLSKHTVGSTAGTNDSCTDSGISWNVVNFATANAAASRSCTNMCHPDHRHTQPGTNNLNHNYNVHNDASTSVTRTVTRDASGNIVTGTPATTDFVNSGNGGMCLSCHTNAADANHPAIALAAYNSSAHNVTTTTPGGAWTYTLHDGSLFARNCTKCHSDRGDAFPNDGSTPFGGVHYSDYPSLLAGSTNPNNTPATFVCYNCHGDGTTTGQNYSGKVISTQIAKAGSNHPANADNVHNSLTEFNNAAFGNTLGGLARHVNCLDCHDPHEAKAGTHAAQTNQAGPPLNGAWGAQLSTNPAFWTAPTSASFTKKVIVSGTDVEATVCFKCHSSYYGTLPAAPSWSPNTWLETDTAKEFNPNNVGNFAGTWASGETAGSFHPVLASAGSNLGATSNIIAPWTRTSLMTCSDCHESDTTTDPNGPHGSTAKFILKGPNTAWNNTITNNGTMQNSFCTNCHNNNYTNSRYPDHTRNDHFVACFNCHSAIPHGGPRPGFLNAVAANANVGGLIATWDSVAPYAQRGTGNSLCIQSYPTNNTTNWGQNNCGCGTGCGH